MKSYLSIVPILFLLNACSTHSENHEEIDYAALPEVPVDLVMDIGENENFIPAQLRDLVLTSEGSLLVSDWGSTTIEQFNTEGEHVKTVAKEGRGPGELDAFFSMIRMSADTVMVSQQGGRNDFFAPDGNGFFSFVKTAQNENRERPVNKVGAYSETEYFASTINMISDVQSMLTNPEDYSTIYMVIVDSEDQIVADSLHQLKSPMGHLTQIENGITFYTIPYRFHDRFVQVDEERYMIARPDSSELLIYDKNHQINQRIPLAVASRPVTSENIDYFLKDVDRKIRQDMEPRIKDEKPPYLELWASEDYIWLHTDTSEEGKEMVVIDYEGAPAGKFLLSDLDEIKVIEANRIYTLHKDPDWGDSIRVYEAAI